MFNIQRRNLRKYKAISAATVAQAMLIAALKATRGTLIYQSDEVQAMGETSTFEMDLPQGA